MPLINSISGATICLQVSDYNQFNGQQAQMAQLLPGQQIALQQQMLEQQQKQMMAQAQANQQQQQIQAQVQQQAQPQQQQQAGGGNTGFHPPLGGQPLPGMAALPPPPPQQNSQQQQMQQMYAGDTGTVIYKPNGGMTNVGANQGPRGPLPIPAGNTELSSHSSSPDDGEFPPPPPVRGNGAMSADTSLNDSASTTQSNVTSECSEAECDREPLVKQNRGTILNVVLF